MARYLVFARSRYEGGLTTYLEVVTAEAIALANERAAVELQARRMTSSVGLIRALGGGWQSSEIPTGGVILAHGPAEPERAQPAGAEKPPPRP